MTIQSPLSELTPRQQAEYALRWGTDIRDEESAMRYLHQLHIPVSSIGADEFHALVGEVLDARKIGNGS